MIEMIIRKHLRTPTHSLAFSPTSHPIPAAGEGRASLVLKCCYLVTRSTGTIKKTVLTYSLVWRCIRCKFY
jgi:hypothetical protein